MRCIPEVDAGYVARMEGSARPLQPTSNRQEVCFDESPTQLIGEARQPIPAKPGQLQRSSAKANASIGGSIIASCSSSKSPPGNARETKAVRTYQLDVHARKSTRQNGRAYPTPLNES
jgi:hypothetical protein